MEEEKRKKETESCVKDDSSCEQKDTKSKDSIEKDNEEAKLQDKNYSCELENENSEVDCKKTNESCEVDKNQDDSKKNQDDFESRFIRLSADFANYKKRSEKEKAELYKSANSRLLVKLLPIIDDFERALSHSDLSKSNNDAFVGGVQMIFKQMMDILTNEGLEYIETENAYFDPNLHHAVMMEEKEGVESGKITIELQKGYKFNGKVIRASVVKVAE